MEVALKYICPKTHCQFLSATTCAERIKRAAGEKRTVTAYSDAYWICSGCKGPELAGEPTAVRVRELEAPMENRAGKNSALAIAIRAGKQAQPVRERKPKREGVMKRFLALGPDDSWTGTTCGHTKPRKEFTKPHECMECARARGTAMRRSLGIQARKPRKPRRKPLQHGLKSMKIGEVRMISVPPEEWTLRQVLGSVMNEARKLKTKGIRLWAVIHGHRVRVERLG
jgi:hypothetical protein